MFGYVAANWEELTQPQKDRYGAVYCGICRCIGKHSSAKARLTLQYDMAFLALLLMSLYEPQEASYPNACLLHPIKKRPWVDNIYVRDAADINVALAYYKCLDDWQDEGKSRAKHMAKALKPHWQRISQVYPRQCRAIEEWILWIIVDAVEVFMWWRAWCAGEGSISVLLMWLLFLANGIYLLSLWMRVDAHQRHREQKH
jgi:hypothetical protein